MRRCLRLLLGAAAVSLGLPPALAAQPSETARAADRWRGTLSFRGDRWPVRLEVAEDGEGCAVRLDLPALVLAREPVGAECAGGGLTVEMPFGLGAFRLDPVSGDSLRGSSALGGDTATLALGVDPEEAPRRVDLTLVRDSVRLAASLLLPPGAGPHPAVVLLHGSAPMGRDDWEYRSWADLFARRGVAALYYDKRGVGESTGGPGPPSFDALVGDALAAVDSLRARPEVDRCPIGLSGGSQAGWLSLLAASRSDDVAFLVLRSAPAFTPSAQEEQSVVHRLRAAERPEAHVQDALAHTRLFFYVTRTGRGWDELAASVRRAEGAGWGDFVQRPASPADLAWWRKHHDVDPLPLLRELDVPTLALYGGADPVVPPGLNAPVFRHAVPEGTPVRVETFPLADHGLEVGAGRVEGERWRFPHRPDRMFEVLDAWLDEHVEGRRSCG